MRILPLRVRKWIRIEPRRVRASEGVRNKEKHPSNLFFNNPRLSILPGNAPDPKVLYYLVIIKIATIFFSSTKFFIEQLHYKTILFT